MSELDLPNRYEPARCLGKGGGGEVWAVRDRHTGADYALKVLAIGASEREMAALVREAVALSGLEGLGVPRVVRFGRLPASGRPFMVRELVEGRSLEELIESGADPASSIEALARAADQLTFLHRSGLLHGDVKPANIIVEPSGAVTFVDLGLSAPWREGGALAEGLTPRYAAPELFAGKPLTVRAEVYALGVALQEILQQALQGKLESRVASELEPVAARAIAADPDARFPSVDEFASALRRAAPLPAAERVQTDVALWPIVGIETTSGRLLEAAHALEPGGALRISGPPGSGRSALVRRLAWSLGIEGRPLAWIDDALVDAPTAVDAELAAHSATRGLTILVDAADALEAPSAARLVEARRAGARLILVGGASIAADAAVFEVPPLDDHAAAELVRRAIPSLTDRLLERVVRAAAGRPGELRRVVRRIASEAVASTADVERLLGSSEISALPEAPLDRAIYFLNRGRFNDAKEVLQSIGEASDDERLTVAIAKARLELGLGEAGRALELLEQVQDLAQREGGSNARLWALWHGRSLIGVGRLEDALRALDPVVEPLDEIGAEAGAYRGLALSFLGRHDEAKQALEQAIETSSAPGRYRVHAVALASLGLACQRNDRVDEAEQAYQDAILAAERAGDAGMLATVRLNLAGLLKMRGDIARAIDHFEAAVDMGRRSGRRSAARSALLSLANTDLYLGRLARAHASIEALEQQRQQLPPVMRAQLLGLQAEHLALTGQTAQALRQYEACAAAYEALGRNVDAAEARLEGVLVGARVELADIQALGKQIQLATEELADAPAHRHMLLLATGRLRRLAGDENAARDAVDDALKVARDAGQREWVWRALEARAELEEAGGQLVLARRDREEALAVLEDIGARLSRDLREVYWNDPRRRHLKGLVQRSMASAATEFLPFGSPLSGPSSQTLASGTSSISSMTSTPLEQRLARILEINHELAGVLDLDRLTAHITDSAVNLLRAERGYVILKEPDGTLTVHTSRSAVGDEPAADFSRSIAQSVILHCEPMLSLSARDDARMKSYASVHQAMLQSVACVPIRSPGGTAIGALYLETRVRPGAHFERELPTLMALADQMAIAIENARLINENKRRADELQEANAELEEAHARLRELLGDRTAKLKRARQQLRDARDTLYGHFGYQGLVGTSAAMRRVYALVERVKDTDVAVLITGESGTGKEMVARAIHNASLRNKKKLLGVNCGAIPENLLESELFGHVRGAFTGADRDRKGLFREGEGGSLLLDEIGEMPAKMQAGLLRVLQDNKVRPVGGVHEEQVDVRLIFATNRDLGTLVGEGKFREDLYYRIHVVELRLPALRERLEDIPQLVDHFLGRFSARYKREKKTVSREAMRRLMAYDWPGNVRQLEHVLLNAWVLSEAPELEAADLDLPDGYSASSSRPAERAPVPEPPSEQPVARAAGGARTRRAVSEHRMTERERIVKALEACNWNRVKAAEMSGIPRRTFYRRLREYGIQ